MVYFTGEILLPNPGNKPQVDLGDIVSLNEQTSPYFQLKDRI